ncbi:MAG: NAD(+) synthase [Muribaculaceae bacterium]|nr:NAD(+) synthase [Muribaculaceae bacterium]
MHNGFFRVASCIPPVKVADPNANADAIIEMLHQADRKGVELAVFPELCVTGYTCGDLFHSELLVNTANDAVRRIADATSSLKVNAVVGVPMVFDNRLYNCAVVVGQGRIKLTVPKSYLPNYNEFYERRLWTPAPQVGESDESHMPIAANKIFQVNGVKVGIEICEDLWVPIPPSCHTAMAGAKIIVNLSASPDLIGKYAYLRDLVAQQSARCICGYVYASAGFGESSTDLVFDGKGLIAENGKILAATPRWKEGPQMIVRDIDVDMLIRDRLHIGTFGDCADRENSGKTYPVVQQINLNISELLDPDSSESLREKLDRIMSDNDNTDDETDTLLRTVDPHPFVPWDDNEIDSRCDEIINIQVAGLAQRLAATRCKKLVIGISGGLDSTLALLVATRAFDRLHLDRKGIIGITMPGFGTTGRTHSNALTLMDALGVTFREIPIGPAVEQHFKDIDHDPNVKDVTYENCQARERTQILMDVANQEGGMVLGTGDLSELALGWATYNGDHMSMYAVNASVPKTLVKYLVRWFALRSENPDMAEALVDIIDTPVSPELLPPDSDGKIAQKTEDLVGPYELHDFFLYHTLRYGTPPERVFYLACQAFWVQHTRKAYNGKGGMEVGKYEPREILKWLKIFYRRFFNQQFKRSCMPDGPKVGSVCLSPRGDWRMPSDASATLWLDAVDRLSASLDEGEE